MIHVIIGIEFDYKHVQAIIMLYNLLCKGHFRNKVKTRACFPFSLYSSTLLMTEKVSTASEALASLEQQLTCPVSLDHYTQPRTLTATKSACTTSP